jgi:hypothetical protein
MCLASSRTRLNEQTRFLPILASFSILDRPRRVLMHEASAWKPPRNSPQRYRCVEWKASDTQLYPYPCAVCLCACTVLRKQENKQNPGAGSSPSAGGVYVSDKLSPPRRASIRGWSAGVWFESMCTFRLVFPVSAVNGLQTRERRGRRTGSQEKDKNSSCIYFE